MVNSICHLKNYWKSNNFFLIRNTFIFLSIIFLFISCSKSKLIINSFNSAYINYDKIRIRLTINNTTNNFKGYIYIIKDSSACFRLWGPLGYELGRGLIDDDFKYFDTFNKKTYNNLKDIMEENSGIILNKYIILSLLMGNIDSLSKQILASNKGIVSVSSIADNYLELFHGISHQNICFKYKFLDNYPKKILITSKKLNSKFELEFEIVEISQIYKVCRF